jgi:hypothetical protein
MDVRNFSVARDLLYLSGALMGIALGYLLTMFRRNTTSRSRNRRITTVLFIFSGVVIAFSAAVASSFGDIFSITGLFLAAGICIPVFALAVCFPRAAAYPLILAGGLLVVWLGYSFLRFPLIAEDYPPLLYVYHEEGVYSVRFPAESGQTGDRAAIAVVKISGDQPHLDLEGVLISFNLWYPLVGGTERGTITVIRQNDETLYAELSPENSLLKTISQLRLGSFSVGFQRIRGEVPLDPIPQGANLAVFFAGGALSLQPSWQGR